MTRKYRPPHPPTFALRKLPLAWSMARPALGASGERPRPPAAGAGPHGGGTALRGPRRQHRTARGGADAVHRRDTERPNITAAFQGKDVCR